MSPSLFQAKIQTIQGHARFTNDPEPTVEVNGRKYSAPHILIATGGQPSVLSEAEVPGKTCCNCKKKLSALTNKYSILFISAQQQAKTDAFQPEAFLSVTVTLWV